MKFSTLCFLLVAMLYAMPAKANEPKLDVKWKFYNVKALTAKELKKQMFKKGPNGFWAYAKWTVYWTVTCKVRVEIRYTFPKWVNKNEGSDALQSEWRAMTRALKAHEEVHGSHGINAAKEILASGCKKPRKIIRKWAKQDKVFDKKTRHGARQGVILR